MTGAPSPGVWQFSLGPLGYTSSRGTLEGTEKCS